MHLVFFVQKYRIIVRSLKQTKHMVIVSLFEVDAFLLFGNIVSLYVNVLSFCYLQKGEQISGLLLWQTMISRAYVSKPWTNMLQWSSHLRITYVSHDPSSITPYNNKLFSWFLSITRRIWTGVGAVRLKFIYYET